MKTTTSAKVFLFLILLLAFGSGISVFLPRGDATPHYELPASKPVVALVIFFSVFLLYGGLGFAGLKLSRKTGFPEIRDTGITDRQRIVIPAFIGVCIGVFFIAGDFLFSHFRTFGAFPHPPFPTSLVAAITAGIGEEVLFRLFFIPFWVWLLSIVILRGKWQRPVFWFVSVLSAFAFAFGHLPAIMLLLKAPSIQEIPFSILAEIVILNGTLALFSAYYFRRYGFLAAVGIHFWTDVVWHILYGFVRTSLH